MYKMFKRHKEKNSLGSSGLRGGYSGRMMVMDLLKELLVSLQNEKHGATRENYKHRKQDFREHQ